MIKDIQKMLSIGAQVYTKSGTQVEEARTRLNTAYMLRDKEWKEFERAEDAFLNAKTNMREIDYALNSLTKVVQNLTVEIPVYSSVEAKIKHCQQRAESAEASYGPDAPISDGSKMWAARYVDDVNWLLDQLRIEKEKNKT